MGKDLEQTNSKTFLLAEAITEKKKWLDNLY